MTRRSTANGYEWEDERGEAFIELGIFDSKPVDLQSDREVNVERLAAWIAGKLKHGGTLALEISSSGYYEAATYDAPQEGGEDRLIVRGVLTDDDSGEEHELPEELFDAAYEAFSIHEAELE